MKNNKTVRTPKQMRSKQTTEKILEKALQLFCEKGYYNTTTNEIAKEAQISIGSLYSYFKDKDTIFLEILTRYHEDFLLVFGHINSDENRSVFQNDKKKWLYLLIHELIKRHLSVKSLNRELKALYYIKNDVKAVIDRQNEKIKAAVLELVSEDPDGIKGDNLEVRVLLMVDFISVIVDRIVFGETLTEEDKNIIIIAGVDAIFKALYE